jgi:hypothetical protein
MGGRGSGGRNKKSRERKRVEGHAGKRSPRKHKPTRRRAEAVRVYTGPLGAPPDHFDKKEIAIWDELADLAPEGVVEACDRWAFELLVCLMAKFRRGYAKSGETTQIANLLARLGMTPADRDRVKHLAPAPKKIENPWDQFVPPTPQ